MKRSIGRRRAVALVSLLTCLVLAGIGMEDSRAEGIRIGIGIGGPVPRHLPYGARPGSFGRYLHRHRHLHHRGQHLPGGLRVPGVGHGRLLPGPYRGGIVHRAPSYPGAGGHHRVLRPWGPVPYRIRSGCHNVFKVVVDRHGRHARIGGLLCYDGFGVGFIAPGSRYLIGYE